MKITICGSLQFAHQILEAEKQLLKLGHSVNIPPGTAAFLDGRTNAWTANKRDIEEMNEHHNFIKNSDAILIVNHEKNNIPGYVGGAGLMEMTIAYHLGKKIFVMNELPSLEQLKYVQEISLMQPLIINNDLSLIK